MASPRVDRNGASVGHFELRQPIRERDVGAPLRTDQHQAFLMPGMAGRVDEPEEPRLQNVCACLLPHLTMQGVFPRLAWFGATTGKTPSQAVFADDDELAGFGDADSGRAVRLAGGLVVGRVPHDGPVPAVLPNSRSRHRCQVRPPVLIQDH